MKNKKRKSQFVGSFDINNKNYYSELEKYVKINEEMNQLKNDKGIAKTEMDAKRNLFDASSQKSKVQDGINKLKNASNYTDAEKKPNKYIPPVRLPGQEGAIWDNILNSQNINGTWANTNTNTIGLSTTSLTDKYIKDQMLKNDLENLRNESGKYNELELQGRRNLFDNSLSQKNEIQQGIDKLKNTSNYINAEQVVGSLTGLPTNVTSMGNQQHSTNSNNTNNNNNNNNSNTNNVNNNSSSSETKPQQDKSTWEQLMDVANGKTNSTNPKDIKDNAKSIYEQMLSYYNNNQKNMTDYEREMANTYLYNAELDYAQAQNLYDSYVESYNRMADSKAASQVARDNAYKYTMEALQRNGLGTQGLAESTYAGIGNQYSRNLNDLEKTHTNNMNDVYSSYQNALLNNKKDAIDDRNILIKEQKAKEQEELLLKREQALTNVNNVFELSSNTSEMLDVLNKNKNELDESTYEYYQKHFVSSMLENAQIESTTDAMYNSFGSYFMNNEVPNGQIFVLQNEKGKDAHYFEYQNGMLIELKRKDVKNKEYIHFDSKGTMTVIDNK